MTFALNPAVQACAVPNGSVEPELLSIISRSNRRWINVAKVRDRQILDQFPGSRELLDRWHRANPDWTVDWHCTFGSFNDSEVNADQIAAWFALLLHLSSHFPEVDWGSTAVPCGTFRWSHTILSGITEVHVTSQRLSVRVGDEWQEARAMPQNTWIEWRNQGIDLFQIDGWRSIVDGNPTNHDDWLIDGSSVTRLCAAFELLETLPSFADWVRQVLRVVVFLPASPGVTMSLSDDRNPSTVRLTVDDDPANGAELLVHECAHIYLSILEREIPLVKGLDRHLYYSPFRKTVRPLRSILVGYHAFANVAAMYRHLAGQGYHIQSMKSRCEALNEQLRPLKDIFEEADDLTVAGRAFYKKATSILDG